MALVPIFQGRVTESGTLVLEPREQIHRRAHLRSLAGKDIEIVIRKRREQRSLDQNAYIHAVPVPIIAEHCGYSIAECKLVLMGTCWGWKVVAGHEVPIKASTADMSIDEGSYFIDWVIPWALEFHGLEIPYPREVEH